MRSFWKANDYIVLHDLPSALALPLSSHLVILFSPLAIGILIHGISPPCNTHEGQPSVRIPTGFLGDTIAKCGATLGKLLPSSPKMSLSLPIFDCNWRLVKPVTPFASSRTRWHSSSSLYAMSKLMSSCTSLSEISCLYSCWLR